MLLDFETLFSELHQYHGFSLLGWVDGWEEVGWVGSRRRVIQRQSHCALNEAQKQPHCTCQAKTVVGSSLTPRAALLVLAIGTVYAVVDRHEFTGSEKCCL